MNVKERLKALGLLDSGFNDDSRTGYKGAPTNCSLVAMSNLGLEPDPTYFNPLEGMDDKDILKTVSLQLAFQKKPPLDFAFPSNWREVFYTVTAKDFANKYADGLFLVFTKDHVAVIDNGTLLNINKDVSIESAWRVS